MSTANSSPTQTEDSAEIQQLQQGSVKSLQEQPQVSPQHQIPMIPHHPHHPHAHHDPTAAMALAHSKSVHPHAHVNLQQLSPFAFNPLLNMQMMMMPTPPMNMKLPSSSPMTPHKKSDKMAMTPVYSSGGAPSTPISPATPSGSNSPGGTGKNASVFNSNANRTWKIQDIDPELQQYLLDEKFDVKITMKIRGEEACQYVPEKLYSSHRYVVQHEMEVGPRMQAKYPLLVSKIKVISPLSREEITNSKTGKEIVKGVIECALTLHNNKPGHAILQGLMKIQFTDVSYHHEKGHFAMVISYFDPASLEHALFSVSSPEFRVYARKPTHAGQTETLKPGKPKPTIRKRKKEESTPSKTPQSAKRAKPSTPTHSNSMSKDYETFIQKLDELTMMREQLSDEDKLQANEQSLQRLLQNDPDITMDLFVGAVPMHNPMFATNAMLHKTMMGMNPNLSGMGLGLMQPMTSSGPTNTLDLGGHQQQNGTGVQDEEDEEEDVEGESVEHHHHHHHHHHGHHDHEHQEMADIQLPHDIDNGDEQEDDEEDHQHEDDHHHHHHHHHHHGHHHHNHSVEEEEHQPDQDTAEHGEEHDVEMDDDITGSQITPLKKRLKK